MIDAQITRATCQVTCGDEVGTGWLVTSTRVMTARHCVADAIAAGAQVDVRFELDGVAEVVTATVVADEQAIDACVLQLAREIDLAPILLDESLPVEGSRFSAFGFPVAKLSLGHRLEGSISRVLDAPKLIMDLDLHVDAPAALTNYEGISGAALICDDRCRGMLRIGVDKSLGALSVARMSAFLRQHSIPIGDPSDDGASAPALASREEFTKAFDSLVSTVAGGYAFIEGAHGIGKSTFCETYRPSVTTLEHFGTYSFTSHTGGANAMHLAQPEVFFDWLNTLVSSHLTGKAGRVSEKRYSELIVGVGRLLDMLAKTYSSQGKIGVIFVDGLDEVAKIGQGLERFVGLLPPKMPAGLAFVFSAPSYVNLSAALGARMASHACIAMPALAREASRAFCASALLPERASAATVRIICDRAQGHALYLRYLIDLANGGADDEQLAALPLIDGSIRNYYDALWPQLLADPEAVNFLAIIARLRWGIPTEQLAEILNDAERAVLVTTLARIQHLLLRRDATTIYHSSFADFLIEKTALRELDVQRRLADYCATHPNNRYGTLNTVYHGLRSGEAEEARTVAICDQGWVDRCVTLGGEPDALLGDVDEALAAAAQQGSLVEVVRLLLLAQRILFRYDTLFAQSADLAADALIALGKTREALQHAVRYGRLIMPVHQALRLALQLTTADESEAALDILDKAEAVLERQLSNQELTIGNFVAVFELRIQLLLLRVRAGDEAASHALPNFYGWSIGAIRDNIEDEKARRDCLSDMASYFGASMACLAGRYAPVSVLREYHSGSTSGLEQILLRLLASYRAFCSHFGVAHDRSLLDLVFADVRTLLDELGHEWDRPSLGIIDAIVSLGAPTSLVHRLVDAAVGELTPLQFVAADNVNMDAGLFAKGMAQWRLASLLDKDLPCPVPAEIQASGWRDGVDSICRALAWCDGAARRANECGDVSGLQSAWSLLEQRVFERLRFTLAQRAEWNDSYAVPEAVFPELYERLTDLVADVFPERLGHMLSFVEERFAVQCGLYSEGFRSVLAKVLERVAGLPLEAEVETQAFALLQHWRNFVQSNVKNRHELVPELLTVIPLFVRLKASEEAHRTYQAVLAFSMGPSWYKEDQLSLMTGALQRVPRGEPLEAGLMSRVAGSLEAASGEMTFQRFVRYDKAALIGALCRREDYSNAVSYFLRQSCGTAEQLLIEASEGEIDRTAPLRGMRFPGGALDEQDALYRMLTWAIPAAHWPLCWALLEIYQFGDTRHLERSAEAYARLAERAREEGGAHAVMVERLKIICEGELDEAQRGEVLSELRRNLPPDLLESFKEILGESPPSSEVSETPLAHRGASNSDVPEDSCADGGAQGASARDALVMPGMFGTSGSTRESDEALSRAERQLARGNASAAQTEALAALEHLQRGGWSIWGDLSSGAKRAEDILRHEARSADVVVKLYAPLILSERYADKWRRADHLIERIAPIATPDERAALVRLVVEHVETMIGDAAAKAREYQFLEEARALDASSSLLQLILAAVDHPQWLRRDKAAELVLWLLFGYSQYIPIVGPMAFTMDSGNLPDVLCGVLEHLSISDATNLWNQLAPALDLDEIQRNCRHVGRLAVLLRIADRAARKGSTSVAAALERVRASIPQSDQGTDVAAPPQVQCPAWALAAEREWHELTAMGLATDALVQRAASVIQATCAPLSVETAVELERLLVEGFRDDPDHPLGRWKAKVRYALQVALLPQASEAVLTRIDHVFRTYNPARIGHLRILGYSSPSAAWLAALSGSRGMIEPARGNDVYLDFFERVWDGQRFRILRLTAFFYRSNGRPVPPNHASGFPSTELPTSTGASAAETCARVEWRPAFFGSFTPAVPSAALMQMTGATGADLTRAHWRIGRTPATRGAGPEHEGCFLAIKRAALRLPRGVRLAWVYEIDGMQLGIVSRAA